MEIYIGLFSVPLMLQSVSPPSKQLELINTSMFCGILLNSRKITILAMSNDESDDCPIYSLS